MTLFPTLKKIENLRYRTICSPVDFLQFRVVKTGFEIATSDEDEVYKDRQSEPCLF